MARWQAPCAHAGFRWQPCGGELLVATLFLLSARALDIQCKDPLFQTHWFGEHGHSTWRGPLLPTLNSMPTVKTGLQLCPKYSGRASCCSTEFEASLGQHFNYYRQLVFPAMFAHVARHRQSVADVRNTAAYSDATRVEKEQLQLALERFNMVLAPSTHSTCLSTLLAYAAGMHCFSCQPDWSSYVTLDNNQVVRVHVQPIVCMDLWAKCESFGTAEKTLRQALLDSPLAKQAKSEYQDLRMFSDQQALCNWLHNEVALHPFRRPSEADRETEPFPSKRRLDAMWSAGSTLEGFDDNATEVSRRLGQTVGEKELDVLAEGAQSGFNMVWNDPYDSNSGQRVGMLDAKVWLCAVLWSAALRQAL